MVLKRNFETGEEESAVAAEAARAAQGAVAGEVPKAARVEAPAAPAAAAAPAPAAAPAASPVRALTPAKPPASAVKKLDVTGYDVVAMFKDMMPRVGFGEGTRLVASQGTFLDGDKNKVGDQLRLQMLSWNSVFVVSPGGENNDETRKLTRYSEDGVTTTKGEDVQEYLRELKAAGHDSAALKEYYEVFGILLECNGKERKHLETALIISVSPDSVKSFNAMRRDVVVKATLGKLGEIDASQGLELSLVAEATSRGNMTWTKILFSFLPKLVDAPKQLAA